MINNQIHIRNSGDRARISNRIWAGSEAFVSMSLIGERTELLEFWPLMDPPAANGSLMSTRVQPSIIPSLSHDASVTLKGVFYWIRLFWSCCCSDVWVGAVMLNAFPAARTLTGRRSLSVDKNKPREGPPRPSSTSRTSSQSTAGNQQNQHLQLAELVRPVPLGFKIRLKSAELL